MRINLMAWLYGHAGNVGDNDMRLERHIKQAAEYYGVTVSEYAKFAAEMVRDDKPAPDMPEEARQ